MLKKILISSLFVMLIVAFMLFTLGVERVEDGSTYYDFLKTLADKFDSFSLKIPDIPEVPPLSVEEGDWLGEILNAFIYFVNGLVGFLNFLIMVVNSIIDVLKFVFILIEHVLTYPWKPVPVL